jgi:hypothetical protein
VERDGVHGEKGFRAMIEDPWRYYHISTVWLLARILLPPKRTVQ